MFASWLLLHSVRAGGVLNLAAVGLTHRRHLRPLPNRCGHNIRSQKHVGTRPVFHKTRCVGVPADDTLFPVLGNSTEQARMRQSEAKLTRIPRPAPSAQSSVLKFKWRQLESKSDLKETGGRDRYWWLVMTILEI